MKKRKTENGLNWIGLWLGLLCGVGLSTAVGCTDPPPPSLNSADRKLVDSLYRDSAAIVRVEMDSLCALRRPVLVQRLSDSILAIRLADRARQLERLKKRAQ